MVRRKGLVIQLGLCLMTLAACLFSYLEKQNEITELRLYVPKLVKEIKMLQEKNIRLNYQIQIFESPENLMKLAANAKFSHLKYPLSKEILVLEQPSQIDLLVSEKTEYVSSKFKHTLAVGAK